MRWGAHELLHAGTLLLLGFISVWLERVESSPSAAARVAVWMNGRETNVFAQAPEWDEKGYAMAFGCQGRFGNQFDYMLGTMNWAKSVDRTLIIAPWVDYNARSTTSQYPYFPWFKEFFDEDTFLQFNGGRVLDAADFLHHFRERWKSAQSTDGKGYIGYCGYRKPGATDDACMTFSVPKGPFWSNLNITFDSIVGPVGDRRDPNVIAGLKHPVLAMDCSPGKYPAPNDLDQLSSYFKWSKPVLRDSFAFIGSSLRRPFVAVHFRTAFAQASCGFSVRAQCGEWESPERPLSDEVCTPGIASMEAHLRAAVNAVGAASIFVASDKRLSPEMKAMFTKYAPVASLQYGMNENDGHLTPGGGGSPQIDLALLTLADHTILHCPSSFSNIAKRLRAFPHAYADPEGGDDAGPPVTRTSTSFWGIEDSLPKAGQHSEL